MHLTETCGGTWHMATLEGRAVLWAGRPLGRCPRSPLHFGEEGKASLLPQPDFLKLIFIQACLMAYVSKAYERVCVCF